MTFAQRRNRLTTYFSERIPVVERRISVSLLYFWTGSFRQPHKSGARAALWSPLVYCPQSVPYPVPRNKIYSRYSARKQVWFPIALISERFHTSFLYFWGTLSGHLRLFWDLTRYGQYLGTEPGILHRHEHLRSAQMQSHYFIWQLSYSLPLLHGASYITSGIL
jgi:hypothetical protein